MVQSALETQTERIIFFFVLFFSPCISLKKSFFSFSNVPFERSSPSLESHLCRRCCVCSSMFGDRCNSCPRGLPVVCASWSCERTGCRADSAGLDVNIKSEPRYYGDGTPLFKAVFECRHDVVLRLLEARADPLIPAHGTQSTVLHVMHSTGAPVFSTPKAPLDIFEELITYGARPCLFMADHLGRWPVHMYSTRRKRIIEAMAETLDMYTTHVEAVLPVRDLALVVVSYIGFVPSE